MRTKLTRDEFNSISKLTHKTKLDNSFDIISVTENTDAFVDFFNNDFGTLSEGLEWLFNGIAYPCEHDSLTKYEGELVANLLIEFGYADEEWEEWYLKGEC